MSFEHTKKKKSFRKQHSVLKESKKPHYTDTVLGEEEGLFCKNQTLFTIWALKKLFHPESLEVKEKLAESRCSITCGLTNVGFLCCC
mgnify:CR=1 FL=1